MSNKPTVTLIESLFSQSKDYIDTRLELLKLKTIDKSTSIASSIVSGIAFFIVFLIFFIFLNIGIALLIGDLVGRASWGFLILAAFYAVVGLVLFYKRNSIFKTPITKVIIGKFL